MSSFQNVIGRAIASTDFCTRLIADPENVLRESGVEPTTEMLTAFKRLDVHSVQRLAAAFGQKNAAAA